MSQISKFIIWIFKRFTRDEILKIIDQLIDTLNSKDPDLQPRDKFKEQHPNYRDFYIDSLAPVTKVPESKNTFHYKDILRSYHTINGKTLKPVNLRKKSTAVADKVVCPHCQAPSIYLYLNNGRKKSQVKCKVCSNTSPLEKRHIKKSKFFCPYCFHALYLWKRQPLVTIYKCCNDNCTHRIRQLNKLNIDEKYLRKSKPSQFKLNYQFREYHFKPNKLRTIAPHKPKVDLSKIHNDINTFSLILTLHISYAITARKTAHMLKNIFNLDVSYQTILNYAQAAAYYCHQFNKNNKGAINDLNAGDETYIKILGQDFYTWFFMGTKSRVISAYHISNSRDTVHAVKTMLELLKTAKIDQKVTCVTDGNPAYQASLHFINFNFKHFKIALHNVIGLANLDAESEKYRRYKQQIERLNRTYKYHIQPGNGFNSFNGAVSKTVLFVTYYNFIRPHKALNYQTPVKLSQLEGISTIQGKWAKIISLAA
jgi:transposase-like protein